MSLLALILLPDTARLFIAYQQTTETATVTSTSQVTATITPTGTITPMGTIAPTGTSDLATPTSTSTTQAATATSSPTATVPLSGTATPSATPVFFPTATPVVVTPGASPSAETATLIPFPEVTYIFPQATATDHLLVVSRDPADPGLQKQSPVSFWRRAFRYWPIFVLIVFWGVLIALFILFRARTGED